ncbi:MAG: F-type H+-transporting ATPase subunit b [Acidobacteriota bacterium]|jgi:F-type H+-transporting ATPase subunit b|nr:F-type H+-transporting ATPase subunit b [Acidobacteriota bacterium]
MTFVAFAENSIQLVPDGTLFLHIAIILLMVFVLNATLFKPINRILEERERRTRGRSGEAHDILQRVEEKVIQYERTLREARAEGYRLMERERDTAMTERQARLNTVRDEINHSVAEEKGEIHGQVEEARTTLEQEARLLAAEIGSQILHRPINESVKQNLGLNA